MTARSTPAGTTAALAEFVADLRWEDIPAPVIERTKDLFLDWFAAALAGRGARPVVALEAFARRMGPLDGASHLLTTREHTSPLFAALVNAAASHVVEQDDVHNGAVFHPGTVVFPATLAVAQEHGASGRELLLAAVAGYEVGVRVGEFLGRSHYRVFHTTGTAGTIAAAAAVASLLRLDAEQTLHALGSAGTQAAGLWEFLADAADSKQLHCAKAAADGLLAAYLAADGVTGARAILEGQRGMAAGMSNDADPVRLTDQLGQRWAVLETSFKFHASCRHTHPAADALLVVMRAHDLRADDIRRVRARVHQGALDVLGPVVDPRSVHQSKFSMGFVLALIALHGRAGVGEFSDAALGDQAVRAFLPKVEMVLDPEVDAAYPTRWLGRVDVELADGRALDGRVDIPKGDPENTLSRTELVTKARALAAYAGGATPAEIDAVIARVWKLDDERQVSGWLPRSEETEQS